MAITANSVQCDIALNGAPLAPLAHPYTATTVYTFSNAKMVRTEERLSDTTRDDFSVIFASQQPGMPTTGSANDNGNGALFLVVALGAALLAAGLIARRTSRSAA